ncbi:MAG TPA: polymer-forming cytoskeletal protein [Patescibacteria group bacterium]
MKKLKIISLLAALGLIFGNSVFAAEFVKPDQESGTITLPASETHHNLYTAGGNVIINSKITGDLYAAGGMVKIIGDVEDNLTVAGGNLDISGKVGRNIRIAGGNISINNAVGSDLLAAGGNIFIAETASIAGDLVSAGGNIELHAPVNGKLMIAAGTVVINNVVKGDVVVTADKKLTFGPKAQVSGKITYYGNSDPVIASGAKVGIVDKHPIQKRNHFAAGLFGVGIVISLLAWIAAGLLLLYLLRRGLTMATDSMREEPWANLGIGLIALIIVPIVALVLLLTLIGYYIALLLIVGYVFALMFSCLFAAVFLGKWLFGYIDKNISRIDWRVVVLGIVAFKILKLIPFIGWLLVFLLSMLAFGAILRMTYRQLRRE